MPPLVSVIIPAYNAGLWITETLESVVHQTHERLEVIVVDDGSTDDTVEQVGRFGRGARLVCQANQGTGAARNAGLRVATGEYVALLDHDDLWRPDKLTIQLSVAARHPRSGLIVCDAEEFDGNRILTAHLLPVHVRDAVAASPEAEVTGDFFESLVRHNLISCLAQTLIPRPVVDRIGPLTSIRSEPSDYEYYLRIAAHYPVTFHAHRLARWRYLPSSRSGPAERRDLVWALMRVRMFQRHLREGTLSRRDTIASALRDHVAGAARAAYYHGRAHDPGLARSYLLTLARTCPTGVGVVMVYLAALWTPERVIRAMRRLTRGLKR